MSKISDGANYSIEALVCREDALLLLCKPFSKRQIRSSSIIAPGLFHERSKETAPGATALPWRALSTAALLRHVDRLPAPCMSLLVCNNCMQHEPSYVSPCLSKGATKRWMCTSARVLSLGWIRRRMRLALTLGH